jgi:hyperosmotically inducible periplasmic protein
MELGKWVSIGLVCGVLGASVHAADEQSSSSYTNNVSEASGAAKDADNTARNKRNRENATVTPEDQSNNKSDLEITRNIRRALMKSDDLSMTAKNIKIITIDGKVTLRGPVKTDNERNAINKIAEQQGAKSLDNQLEVKKQSN